MYPVFDDDGVAGVEQENRQHVEGLLRTGSDGSCAALHLEILALRHQLDVLQRTRPRRVRLAWADRWLWVMLARVWAGWRT